MINLKFSVKLLGAFLLLAIATMFAGGYGFVQLNRMNSFLEDISDRHMRSVNYANEILMLVNDIRRAEIAHTMTELREEKIPEEERINAARVRISDIAGKYRKLVEFDEEIGSLTDFEKSLGKYYETSKNLLEVSSQVPPDPYSISAFLNGKSQSALRDVLKSLEALIATNRAQTDTVAESAKATFATARAGLLIVVGITTICAVLLGIWMSRQITRPLAFAVLAAKDYAKGDLSRHLHAQGRDEVSELLHAMEDMRASLTGVVESVRKNSLVVASASSEIAKGNQDLSNRTEDQAGALENTNASMDLLNDQVKKSAEIALQANNLATGASDVAAKGGEVMGRVVETMKDINGSSKRISEIISVIDAIAFQTNILALNAAVEAARAGEHGRGFAVVASEVRSLAGRCSNAAKEIKALIDASVDKVDMGTSLVNEAGATMSAVVDSIRNVSTLVAEISAASGEQASGFECVGSAISQIDQATQQNAALVEEMAAAAEGLRSQADDLVAAVAIFKLTDDLAVAGEQMRDPLVLSDVHCRMLEAPRFRPAAA